MRISPFVFVIVLAPAVLSGCDQRAAPSGPTAALPARQPQEIDFRVTGMTCEGCASSIKTAVGALPGVQDCRVEFKTGRVQVRFDPGQVDRSKIYAAISAQGYRPL